MTIQRVEKQSMSQNNLPKLLGILFFFCSWFVTSQEQETSSRKLKKVGFLYNRAIESNFLFDDLDYTYKTNVFKGQFFYLLSDGKRWDINLILQPQIHIARHQLQNIQFITPDEPNFEENRARLSQERTISIHAFELGLQFRRKLISQLFFETTLSAGVAYIDKETERLARGFTFVENFSLGFAYQWKSSELYLGSNLGHVSNFNTQEPNSGYNVLGFEVGYRIVLE